MGAMQSLAAGWMFPERVGKVVSISGTARSSPSSVAVRYAQRSGMFFLSLYSYPIVRHRRAGSPYGRSKLEQRILLRRLAATHRPQTRAS